MMTDVNEPGSERREDDRSDEVASIDPESPGAHLDEMDLNPEPFDGEPDEIPEPYEPA